MILMYDTIKGEIVFVFFQSLHISFYATNNYTYLLGNIQDKLSICQIQKIIHN